MLRLEFLQTLQEIKLEASGVLKKFLGQYILNRDKWTKPEGANDLLTIDIVEQFESSFKTKDTESQANIQNRVADLIATAKISLYLKELEAMANGTEKLARTVAFFTQEMFSAALRLLSLNQLMQVLTAVPPTHLSTLEFPPEAFFVLYQQRFQQPGERLAMVRQLPQPILQYVVKIDSVEKLADGLREVDVHLDEQQNRFKLLCLLEFYIRNRPTKSAYTSSGLFGGYLVAPVASYVPGASFVAAKLGYHDGEAKVASAKKFQKSIVEQSWTEMLLGVDEPMKQGKSKQFFSKVEDLARHFEPQHMVSYQDSVLGTTSRTPSPSRS